MKNEKIRSNKTKQTLLFHGSKKSKLSFLEPQYYSGSNGSQDGVGVNLTSNLSRSQLYAGELGNILLVNLNLHNFLTISEDVKLNSEQQSKLNAFFDTLPPQLKKRLATDINGRETHHFEHGDKKEAHTFFKEQLDAHKIANLPDRVKPVVKFEADTIEVHTPRDIWDLKEVNTKDLHYLTNLYDNEFATELFKKISDGLILPGDKEGDNFLSFRKNEVVLAEFKQKDTLGDDFLDFVSQVSEFSGPEWLEKSIKLTGEVIGSHDTSAFAEQLFKETQTPNERIEHIKHDSIGEENKAPSNSPRRRSI